MGALNSNELNSSFDAHTHTHTQSEDGRRCGLWFSEYLIHVAWTKFAEALSLLATRTASNSRASATILHLSIGALALTTLLKSISHH